ncbi:MAG: hypothetical protein LBT12_08670 [Oscillospiraceae bacterium]|jgi:hypothetical protein|nr:hypothetical protein [Oscillospiraceae bacterium]
MVTECKRDCMYFSTYTDTCDFTLLMYRSRGCPRDACTAYKPRAERRTWMQYHPLPGAADMGKEERKMVTPEPPAEPPEDTRYAVADCGHEVYEGESLYDWEDETLCPECVEDKFSELTTEEKARLMGCESSVVRFQGRG